MMVHDNNDFPSDMCTILMAVGATLSIYGNNTTTNGVAISDFLNMNMTGCVILSVRILRHSYLL